MRLHTREEHWTICVAMPIYFDSRSNGDQSTRRAKDQNIMKLFARFGFEQEPSKIKLYKT